MRLCCLALAVVACTSGGQEGSGQPDPGTGEGGGSPGSQADGGASPGAATGPGAGTTPAAPPLTKGGWTFYGAAQGLSGDISDVSADEGGNVYVAGGDAVYAKRRAEEQFLRFDAVSGGLTQNCYATPHESDPGFASALKQATPPGPPLLCPVVSVAGAATGRAAVGFKGHGTDDDGDADWAMESGGVDVVSFDGSALARLRHVFVASPPHTVCAADDREGFADSCPNPDELYWRTGRAKLRQVNRIAVNHDPTSPMYGDVFMGGTHASISVLVANAASRGWVDKTAGQGAKWADAKDVWEHAHPAVFDASGNRFLTGYTYSIAVEPGTGTPWVSNGFRTAWLSGYGASASSKVWWLEPQTADQPLWIDLWPDPGTPAAPVEPEGGASDNVQSLAFCDDGTLWAGSATRGLARFDAGGGIAYLGLPDPHLHNDSVYGLACDPSDGSLWIGLGWGGVMRLKDGAFTLLDPNDPDLPVFARQPVRSIQIDRWTSPRIVYFAFMPTKDASGNIVRAGGVASYSGP
jgi:hypothetical protein